MICWFVPFLHHGLWYNYPDWRTMPRIEVEVQNRHTSALLFQVTAVDVVYYYYAGMHVTTRSCLDALVLLWRHALTTWPMQWAESLLLCYTSFIWLKQNIICSICERLKSANIVLFEFDHNACDWRWSCHFFLFVDGAFELIMCRLFCRFYWFFFINKAKRKGSRQDSNLRGKTPIDF